MVSNFAIFDIGTPELVLILAIALLLFGGKKLPELARSVGESVSELKKSAGAAGELKSELKSQVSEVKQGYSGDNS